MKAFVRKIAMRNRIIRQLASGPMLLAILILGATLAPEKLSAQLYTKNRYSEKIYIRLDNPCHKTRAVFDIGSSTTKLMVAVVDSCKEKVIKILENIKVPVRYREDMIINSSKKLSKDIQVRGLQVLKSLKVRARRYRPSNYVAFVSRTVQQAQNGSGFINNLEKETKLQLVILTKEQEAKLIYLSASQFLRGEKSDYVVWDIGSNSMKMTFKEKNYVHFFSDTAAVTFRNKIIDLMGRKSRRSPNPLQESGARLAQRLAHELGERELSKPFLDAIKGKELIGVGGVHVENFGTNRRDKDNYNRLELKKAIEDNWGKTDTQLGGPFASMEVTNMILVLSYLNVMKKDKVKTFDTNLLYGVLVDEDYW